MKNSRNLRKSQQSEILTQAFVLKILLVKTWELKTLEYEDCQSGP